MKRADFDRYALAVSAAAALLAGCGGSQPPIGASGVVPQNELSVRPTKAGDLLYLSSVDSTLGAYTYPQGRLVASITVSGYLTGICVDKAGNVWVPAVQSVPSGPSDVYEFAHGGTAPIATLSDPGEAVGCSTDPESGNLAVANYGGDLAVFSNASGTPTLYASAVGLISSCSYDNNGDLFVGSLSAISGQDFYLSELSTGSSVLKAISLDKQVGGQGNRGETVQWDGKYMAVTSVVAKNPVKVYQFTISGSTGTLRHTTTLAVHSPDAKPNSSLSFIQGKTMILAGHHGEVGLWPYPNGGTQKSHFFTNPIGIGPAVSLAR